MLQGWFAATGHPQADNPYVLYAASNLGSFAALIAYPVIIEPMLPLASQAQLWSLGFAFVAVLIAATGLFIVRRAPVAAVGEIAPVAIGDRIAWIRDYRYVPYVAQEGMFLLGESP